ncbi:hypothetical protein ATX69_07495 [Oenococcus oeni]|uniref:helix-turn-helix domain-containing protein n=1 Tax=Oenococcus oeni TaxID=1247 RepID=UPI0008F855BA|nr:helix-turn-helix transcriptional regulator [Oenococcus oeni]OIM32950.1 hypothetical protein ATX69_07495 [Oenococcus oeni]
MDYSKNVLIKDFLDKKRIGQGIVHFRNKQGITQDELAAKLNLYSYADPGQPAKTTVASWEQGRTMPNVDTRSKLLKLMQMNDLRFLLGNTQQAYLSLSNFFFMCSIHLIKLVSNLGTDADYEAKDVVPDEILDHDYSGQYIRFFSEFSEYFSYHDKDFLIARAGYANKNFSKIIHGYQPALTFYRGKSQKFKLDISHFNFFERCFIYFSQERAHSIASHLARDIEKFGQESAEKPSGLTSGILQLTMPFGHQTMNLIKHPENYAFKLADFTLMLADFYGENALNSFDQDFNILEDDKAEDKVAGQILEFGDFLKSVSLLLKQAQKMSIDSRPDLVEETQFLADSLQNFIRFSIDHL